MDQNIIIPIFGMLTGIIIPIAVFIWQYKDAKGKRETVLEIAKNLDDPSKVEELLRIFEERKKEPIDYRRNGGNYNFCWSWLVFFGLSFYWKGIRRSWRFGKFYWYWNFDSWLPLPKYWKRIDQCCGGI